MIEDIESAIRSDLESEWSEAEIVDRRANVGFSDGKTTSHTFRIHTDDEKFELTVGPHAVRSENAQGVVDALRDAGWIEEIRQKGRILVEKDEEGFSVGRRPDSIVL
ncbi:MAG: hypothetical protein R3223_06965 [Longimicrobiales bacterium]|nr:hypothetical protein [Longimicrobiales bacterium]